MAKVNVLTSYIFCSTALWGMSVAFADNESTLETISAKQMMDFENAPVIEPQKAPRAEVPDEATTIDLNTETKALIDLLQKSELGETIYPQTTNTQKSPPHPPPQPEQRKTHYGIGYEYRNALREAEKQQQIVERTETTQKIERIEKNQRPERIERPDRVDRPERITRPERPNR